MNPTILTHSGISFNLLEPDGDLVEIEDIAHALSHLCRFTGHTNRFYSVAEHCVRAARHVAPEFRLKALLHDATEAYLGDVSSPLKALLHEYRLIEFRLDCVIRERYGLPLKQSPEVKQADLAMLAAERESLMPSTGEHWPLLDGIEPADNIRDTMSPAQAHSAFLTYYALCSTNPAAQRTSRQLSA